MVETDWREILIFSQRELTQKDKESLCESLSWMEADDIELNFTDLKTLFRLAQDILKFKNEQVNNLLGELQSVKRKGKKKSKSPDDSPARSVDTAYDTLAQQEDLIKANKEILKQLYEDIAKLEGHKNKLEHETNADKESDSSRDALSEMDAIEQLEKDVTLKNRHIRKLLGDIKVLEEENSQLKEKTSSLKDNLTEATQVIENLTEQLLALNGENIKFKESLGKSEQAKSQLLMEIELIKRGLSEKEAIINSITQDLQAKQSHWKNIAKLKKLDIDKLVEENAQLKEELDQINQISTTEKHNSTRDKLPVKELQEKLIDATNEINRSVKIIEDLKIENLKLKNNLKKIQNVPISESKNESDDNKVLILKLKKRISELTVAMKHSEEMLDTREKELSEVRSQLQLLQSGEEGIATLLDGLKSRKRQIKLKDESIKSLVQEVNNLNQAVDNLEIENETLRNRLNIDSKSEISTKGTLKRYKIIEQSFNRLKTQLRNLESQLTILELDNYDKKSVLSKITKHFHEIGYSQKQISELCNVELEHKNITQIEGGSDDLNTNPEFASTGEKSICSKTQTEIQAIIDENEGLRKGLQELLDFLKDNSTSSSGILALKCPSLESILQSMAARHSAGWFAPHMAALLELKTAEGGRDALLSALHEARKETFDIMEKLTKESQRSQELEQRLQNLVIAQTDGTETRIFNDSAFFEPGEFGSWMSEEDNDLDFDNRDRIEQYITKGNTIFENQMKKGLEYFQSKFKALFDKMTSIAVQAADEQNKWSLQEEQYKAEIENLKIQLLQKEDEDCSEDSPGIVNLLPKSSLQRKCDYLEESYKYIRTLNENIKNAHLEDKKQYMIQTTEFEVKIQKLYFSVNHLTDKLRNTIPVDLFWKQNNAFNELLLQHRHKINESVKSSSEPSNLINVLEQDKLEVICRICEPISESGKADGHNKILSEVENSILSKQVERLCQELETNNKKLTELEQKNSELQESQSKLIDTTLVSETKSERTLMKNLTKKHEEQCIILKEQCQHVSNQLDVALVQLQDLQQKQMSNDMEINMLRHQILDLQSTSDNKAIIARLSGEILVAHIQASESHKKIERLNNELNREVQKRIEIEEILETRENIFSVYTQRYESKFRYMYEVLHVLREQYQGCLPLASIQNYCNNIEDFLRKSQAVDDKLNDIEDLRSSLMIKHATFDQIIDISKVKCLEDDDNCPHKLKLIVTQNVKEREIKYCNQKIEALEKSRELVIKHCNYLEKTLILVNQVFEKSPLDGLAIKKVSEDKDSLALKLEDIPSDDDSSSRRSQTITLPKPQVLKSPKANRDMTKIINSKIYSQSDSPIKKSFNNIQIHRCEENANAHVQTVEIIKKNKYIQTESNKIITENNVQFDILQNSYDEMSKELAQVMILANRKTENETVLSAEKNNLELELATLKEALHSKNAIIDDLKSNILILSNNIKDKNNELENRKDAANEQYTSLLMDFKKLEEDKKSLVEEYKQMLNDEREEYSKSIRELNMKLIDLQTQINRKGSISSNVEIVKGVNDQYSMKIVDLEDECFKLRSELDGYKTQVTTYQCEAERWKELAVERLSKMELLSSQLEQRHYQEVESYKAENQHWMSQLNENQKEHLDLRNKLSEQKTLYIKQLTDKDAQIEQLRNVIHSLKTQIMSMQTLMAVNDPSFDLSAIVEVTDSEGSHRDSERLEIRFDSTPDLRDDLPRIPSSSTAIWQEPAIERLRREKQLTGKQNNILRRQIKALAARERRARLEAQNLKNQIYRISSSGSKAATAGSVALQAKIASLQAQLTSARRDNTSSVALWDKWKRAQQASELWQSKYEEKCREVVKLEASLNFSKSAITRLEKEKRVLLSRLSEAKTEKHYTAGLEKQEQERSEKMTTCDSFDLDMPMASSRLPSGVVSMQALMDRVEAQQRRIAALELADKGNETLVNEYEKCLAEITALKGQVLKLESALLEAQIRTPIRAEKDPQPELEYWKSYCDMLKEENVQLSMRLSAAERGGAEPGHGGASQRINDLEQTVLTLRGLVSKLKSEQKTPTGPKRIDSRPSSGRASVNDKDQPQTRYQLESYRTEINNLKRSIIDKDNLLERSKEMLKMAAEREEELLRENLYLRKQIAELTRSKGGFLSA